MSADQQSLSRVVPVAWRGIAEGIDAITSRPDTRDDWIKYGRKITPLYEHPAPDPDTLSEAVGLREDAERFRALMRCGRIKMQGSSGVDPHTLERNGNNVHFGAEFWPEPYGPEWEKTYGESTRWGRACLRHLADAVLEEEARARQALENPTKGTT